MNNPHSLQELKDTLPREVANIPRQVLHPMLRNFQKVMKYGMLSCRHGILCEKTIFDSCYSQGRKDTMYSLKITNVSYTFYVMKVKLNSECSIILWFTMCCDPLIVENTI
jgi:hypothetical protein